MAVTEPVPVGRRADVELRVPADGAYASVLRTTTAGLAARLDFTIDDIEDLRIAVGEAGALVLPAAAPDADLTCSYYFAPGELTVEMSVESPDAPEPDLESFAWQVLTTLAHSADVVRGDGRLRVRLTMRSAVGAGL